MGRDLEASLSSLVRAGDEDRWLAAQYAPARLRFGLLALYALHLELARAPAIVSEPALGEIRLQWWREALAELQAGGPVRGHPVIEALAQTGVIDAVVSSAVERAIDARARLFYDEPFQSVEAIADWLGHAEAYVDRLACAHLGAGPEFAPAISDAALAFALARSGPALAPELAEDSQAKARQLYGCARQVLRAAPAAVAPAVLHLSLTGAYLSRRQARWYFPILKRLRIFVSMLTGRI